MMFKLVLLCCMITFVLATCDRSSCNQPLKIYREFFCDPVYDDVGCCIIRFNCPNLEYLKKFDKSKCHIEGISYNIGDIIHDELTNKFCYYNCKCERLNGTSNTATINCTKIICPTWGNSGLYNCVQENTFNSCCSSKYICEPQEKLKYPKCYNDGRPFLQGAIINPENSCHKCICGPNFDNSTYVNNPQCEETKCPQTLLSIEKIIAGCIPIYFPATSCCPIGWRCPLPNDEVVATSVIRSPEIEDDPLMACKFGNLTLKLHDTIVSDGCHLCACKFPPIAHCVKKFYNRAIQC